jgi:hypothetical protein
MYHATTTYGEVYTVVQSNNSRKGQETQELLILFPPEAESYKYARVAYKLGY